MSRKVTIIGGGPGGYPAAFILAQQGAQVTLIEKDKLGGTCLNRGCIPTKVLLEASHALRQMKTAQRMGIRVKEVDLDYSILGKHKDSVVEGLVKGVERLCQVRKIRVVKGTGVFEASRTVRIQESGEAFKGDAVILATGSVPARIPVSGADGPGVINSDQALSLALVPSSMVIIGAGYIGLEFAQIFYGLGAKVTVLEVLPQALPNEDKDVANELERSLKQEGIHVLTEVTVKGISGEEGSKKVHYAFKGQDHTLEAALVMLAVGRRPSTEGLGLEKAGVKTEKGRVVVNPFMETSVPGIYAIGDAIGGIMLAHVATAEGLTAAENILGKRHSLDYKAVPRCIYTCPEAASVGLTEAEAMKKYGEILVGRFPLHASGKARIMGGSGFAKVIAEKQYRGIVGVHLVGPHVTEMIAEAGAVMNLECTGEELAHTIHPHPTISEMIMEAAMAVEGYKIHSV
jgi:dihydrolipoamide dehydrogenase